MTAVAAHHLLHHNRIFTGLFKSVFAAQIMQICVLFGNVFNHIMGDFIYYIKCCITII